MSVCLECDRRKYKPMGAFYLAFDDKEIDKAEKYTFCKAGYWENGRMPIEKESCKKEKLKTDFRYKSEWHRRQKKC